MRATLLSLALLLSGCDLLGLDEPPEQYEAKIEEIVAPSEVVVGSPFEVVLRGSSGCAEIARVEEEEVGVEVRFTVWLYEKDGICGVAPNHFDIERTLRFDQAGDYVVVAGESRAAVVAG